MTFHFKSFRRPSFFFPSFILLYCVLCPVLFSSSRLCPESTHYISVGFFCDLLGHLYHYQFISCRSTSDLNSESDSSKKDEQNQTLFLINFSFRSLILCQRAWEKTLRKAKNTLSMNEPKRERERERKNCEFTEKRQRT